MHKVIYLISIAFVLNLPFYCNADVQLSFGIYTADKATSVISQFRPILNVLESDMSRSLGKTIKIKTQIANSYEKGIQDLVTGKVDFSRFGPVSYIEAKQANPGLSILAIESKKGEKQFLGIICIHKDSSIKNIQDLKGKRFAFGNELSTIGRYLSQQYLFQSGIKASDLKYYEYLKRHDKVGTAVAKGLFDAGALKEGTLKKLIAKGEPLRPLVSFPNVTKPWIASSSLPKNIQQALRQALLNMNNSNALKALKKDGFLLGTDDDYAVIRKAIVNNKAFFE